MRLTSLKRFKFVLVATVLGLGLSVGGWGWSHARTQVPVITASEIRAFQNNKSNEDSFVIVDVRSKAETAISMIPGALTKSEFEKTSHQHQGKSIIAYCTIGVRSGNYSASLIKNGWRAWNYKGSILDWCEHNLPLMANGKETNKVHTYSRRFSVPHNYTQVL